MQQKRGHCAQNSEMLDGLMRRPFRDFLSFCGILVETNQIHLLLNCFTPEIPEIMPPAKDEGDAVPIDPQYVESVANIVRDWRAAIRAYLVPLSIAIDPDNGLIRELQSGGVISEWNVDIFQVICIHLLTACQCQFF